MIRYIIAAILFFISSFMVGHVVGADVQQKADTQLCIDTTKQMTQIVSIAERCFAGVETVTTEASRCVRTLEVLHDAPKANRHRTLEEIHVPHLPYFARVEFDARAELCHEAQDCFERFPLTDATVTALAESYLEGAALP